MADGRVFCYGHGISALKKDPLQIHAEIHSMWATQTNSGDCWVTCDRHKDMFTLYSRRAPKKIRTLVTCEGCSVEDDLYMDRINPSYPLISACVRGSRCGEPDCPECSPRCAICGEHTGPGDRAEMAQDEFMGYGQIVHPDCGLGAGWVQA